ncbi:MAG: response regulator, partial [Sulfuricaulis sp.]|nr:response regulator [Sulfuricaulis sp.]
MSTVNINPPETGDILVVDNTLTNLKFLAIMLEEGGFNARSAASGELALRSVQDRQPALILLDIKMPGMDGF